MRVNLLIELPAGFDSKELYKLIECYKANLLDDGKKVYVYCDCYLVQAQDIIYHSCLFGDCDITVKHLKEEE